MSKVHSTVSRRDFMKAVGLGAAGLGAAGAAAPIFHDMDELSSSKGERVSQPWWVKEVDKPTVEIDWQLTERYDHIDRLIYYHMPEYVGQAETDRLADKGNRLQKEYLTTGEPADCDLRSMALTQGGMFGWNRDFPEYFLGDPYAPPPEAMGVPRYTGTPEENSRILTAALRFFGASKVGFSKIYDENFRKYFFTRGRDFEGPVIDDRNDPRIGQPRPGIMVGSAGVINYITPAKYTFGSPGSPVRYLEFEDTDKPYADDFKKVIPNSFTNVVVLEIPQSSRLTRTGPPSELERNRWMGVAATSQSYGNLAITQRRVQKFMKVLGYHCLGGGTGGLAPVTAWGVWSGLGEMSRMNPMLTPEWGTMIRSTVIFVTDMELVPTKPIDGGMFRFCLSCTKCADACPYGALQLGSEPTWEREGDYNCSGAKKFFIKAEKCYAHRLSIGLCDNCMIACPFGDGSTSWIHDFVRASASKAPMFNQFFFNMSKTFGYGAHMDVEDCWSDKDEPFGGVDTTVGTRWHRGRYT